MSQEQDEPQEPNPPNVNYEALGPGRIWAVYLSNPEGDAHDLLKQGFGFGGANPIKMERSQRLPPVTLINNVIFEYPDYILYLTRYDREIPGYSFFNLFKVPEDEGPVVVGIDCRGEGEQSTLEQAIYEKIVLGKLSDKGFPPIAR
jgi:hypothetical protein